MRKIAIVFLILLVGIAIVLLPIQGTQEEQHRPQGDGQRTLAGCALQHAAGGTGT